MMMKRSKIARFALLLLLVASAATGVGLSVLFGAMGAYYMAHGMVVLHYSGRATR